MLLHVLGITSPSHSISASPSHSSAAHVQVSCHSGLFPAKLQLAQGPCADKTDCPAVLSGLTYHHPPFLQAITLLDMDMSDSEMANTLHQNRGCSLEEAQQILQRARQLLASGSTEAK